MISDVIFFVESVPRWGFDTGSGFLDSLIALFEESKTSFALPTFLKQLRMGVMLPNSVSNQMI